MPLQRLYFRNIPEPEPVVVVVDGGQKLNDNGRIILEWMEKFKLTMLNDDMKCEGEITWSRNEQNSVIDFALVTDKFYDKFRKMTIDEDQDIIDITDHNLF